MIRCLPCSGCGYDHDGKFSDAAGSADMSVVVSVKFMKGRDSLFKVGPRIVGGSMGIWRVFDIS